MPHRRGRGVEHEGDQLHQRTDNQRHGDGHDHQQHGIGRSIRRDTVTPPTVLVTDMGDESLLLDQLEGWRDGPNTHPSRADAGPLWRKLATAFGATDPSSISAQGEAL